MCMHLGVMYYAVLCLVAKNMEMDDGAVSQCESGGKYNWDWGY